MICLFKCNFSYKKRAITLFEMMIVLSVTLILSGLLIFSSRHLLIRTKMERVKEEHRVLSRALQNYRMDYNDLPDKLQALNAPTAYLSRIPTDPFFKKKITKPYDYFHHPVKGFDYLIISAGPDGDMDLDILMKDYIQLSGYSSTNNSDFEDFRNEMLANLIPVYMNIKTYDPTNGIISDGDIITVLNQN
jgi:type II secretory pathway pseudopilin PulG